MIPNENWEQLEEIIKKNQKFIITTHTNPDGDGLGSELGVFHILEKLGKKPLIINDSPTPQFYKFLDPEEKLIKRYDNKYRKTILETDVIVLMDSSNSERLGSMNEIVKECKAIKVCIDHHHTNNKWANINLVDEFASASGEIVYDLIKRLNLEIDESMAVAIYVSILTDTGSFRFSSTNQKAHFICGELLEKGIKPRKIYGYVYESYSWERMMLFAKTLSTLKKVANGKASSVIITKDSMESSGALREDTEGFVEYIINIKNVEIAVLFLELKGNKVKVSLRSKEKYDVSKIAGIFGGGGHKNASGIVIENCSLKEAENWVILEIEKLFN